MKTKAGSLKIPTLINHSTTKTEKREQINNIDNETVEITLDLWILKT